MKIPRTLFPTLIGTATALFLLIASAFSAEGPLNHQTITFWSDGSRLQGDVFKPRDVKPGDTFPGIILVHGWGGNKSNLNRIYAPQFASLGFIVMTFDMRSWGESDGFFLAEDTLPSAKQTSEVRINGQHVRSIVNPLKMIEDVREVRLRPTRARNRLPHHSRVTQI